MLGFVFVGAGVFSSCAMLNPEPELVADVYYAESESYYGTFGLGVELENTGYGDAVDLNYGPILVEGDFTLDSRTISDLKKSNLPSIETIFKEHKMMTVPEK